jgi:hypothetical protein
MCENNQRKHHKFCLWRESYELCTDIHLELKSAEGKAEDTSQGLIIIQLSTDDQADAIALSNAQHDIQHSDILRSKSPVEAVGLSQVTGPVAVQGSDSLKALGDVVSKLAEFIQFIDKTSMVITRP